MGRIGRRGRKAEQFATRGEPITAREELEFRWRDRLCEEPRLAPMVTAAAAQREPFHRWVKYRQSFSPALIRLFLAETAAVRRSRGVVLDPFCGAGTTVVECARQGVRSAGVEALPSMVFLAAARWARCAPELPAFNSSAPWAAIADQLSLPIHRAALMLAVGRQHTAGGQRLAGAAPLDRLISEVMAMIREDVAVPLAAPGLIVQGDARNLDMLADRCVAGITTSPPYLSRYDYRETASPYELVYRHWYAGSLSRTAHLQASARTTGGLRSPHGRHPAADEVCEALNLGGHGPLACTVHEYLADMAAVLRSCGRVLADGGPCWMIVGGARLRDVYVPADLLVAELAEACGLQVEALRVARDLIPTRRKFGRVGHVSPRENLLCIRKV
jgi:SAM-dependent methyltransferase